jgi:hypothetical protein
MRTRVLFALTVVIALPVVVYAQAVPAPAASGCGTAVIYPAPGGPGYASGTVIGGPMYAAGMPQPGMMMTSPMTPTVVERTGPFGLVRRRVMTFTPTPAMPAPAATVVANGQATTSPITPATATTTPPVTTTPPATTTTGVITSGYVMPPAGMVVEQPVVVRRGLFRSRVVMMPVMVTPPPAMPATTISPAPTIAPASGTETPPTAPSTTAPSGVITGGYVVPPTGTVTVVPAGYTYPRPFFRGRGFYTTSQPVTIDGTTYSTTPGTVTTPTYVGPEYFNGTGYTYPRYRGYFGGSGFGFRWR